MRWVFIAVGVVLLLMGAVWTLQGLNVLPGSRMSGDSFWAGAGVVTVVVGLGILASGAWAGRKR